MIGLASSEEPSDTILLCYCTALTIGELRRACESGTWPLPGKEQTGKLCTGCMGENIVAETLPRTGTLYAFSVVHIAPKKWKLPMRIGYVDLPNGARVFSHLDGTEFAIGDTVEVNLAVVGQDENGAIESFVFKRVSV